MRMKTKILASLFLLSLGTLVLVFHFTYLAFSEDKRQFVMDVNLTLLHAIASDLKVEMKRRTDALQALIPKFLEPPAATDSSLPQADPVLPKELSDELLGLTIYRQKELAFEMAREFKNAPLLDKRRLPPDLTERLAKEHPLPLTEPGDDNIMLLNRSLKASDPKGGNDIAVVTFLFVVPSPADPNAKVVVAIDLVQDFLRRVLQRSELAEAFLIFKSGSLLSHPSLNTTVQFASNAMNHPITSSFRTDTLPSETLTLEVGQTPYFVNVLETGFKDLFIVTQMRGSEAQIPLPALMEKGALVLIFLLVATLAFSLLMASRLTRNLAKLTAVAEQVEGGHLNVPIEIQSRDEMGIIAEGFRTMIEHLKTRAEDQSVERTYGKDELALLRETLLRPPEVEATHTKLASFVIPAPVYGGDFWDAHVSGPWLTIVIGDALGRGEVAALATSMARAAFASLYHEGQPPKPDRFAMALNHTLHKLGHGKMLMTTCIVQLNQETGALSIANAGHPAPRCVRAETRVISSEANADKKNGPAAETLAAGGGQLGMQAGAQLALTDYRLRPGDTLLLCSDGLTEARGKSGVAFAESELPGILGDSFSSRFLADLKGQVDQRLKAHLGDAESQDDVTLVLIRWREPENLVVPEPAKVVAPEPAKVVPPKVDPRAVLVLPTIKEPPEPELVPFAESPEVTPHPPEVKVVPAEAKETEPAEPAKELQTPSLEEELASREAYLFDNKNFEDAA